MNEIHFNEDGSIRLTRGQQSLLDAARECRLLRFSFETTNSLSTITFDTSQRDGVWLQGMAQWWSVERHRFRRGSVTFYGTKAERPGLKVQCTRVGLIIDILNEQARRAA